MKQTEMVNERQAIRGRGSFCSLFGSLVMLPKEQKIIQKPAPKIKASSFLAMEKLNSRKITS
ncbi:MAG: hypothetical protein PHP89_04510 [Candidatus Omnitrophica bacterium]|nr:hypothetical protein [Candidatus Omnitrophota bacterium]MDD3988189.1 hypothetical protein [Candidatus Omnitrophota bacterium]